MSKYLTAEKEMNILFKALNDATRREILELLKGKDMTAGDIADHFSISKPQHFSSPGSAEAGGPGRGD